MSVSSGPAPGGREEDLTLLDVFADCTDRSRNEDPRSNSVYPLDDELKNLPPSREYPPRRCRSALVNAQLRCMNLPPLEQDAATAPPELRGSDVAPLLTGRHRLCAQLPPCAESLRLAPAGV